jgi:hypothetical protein
MATATHWQSSTSNCKQYPTGVGIKILQPMSRDACFGDGGNLGDLVCACHDRHVVATDDGGSPPCLMSYRRTLKIAAVTTYWSV